MNVRTKSWSDQLCNVCAILYIKERFFLELRLSKIKRYICALRMKELFQPFPIEL